MSRIFTTCIFDGAKISFLAFSVAPIVHIFAKFQLILKFFLLVHSVNN